MNIDRLLRKVTSLLITACDPEKIILFGSYAQGQQDHDSDVDILVIIACSGSPFLRDQEFKQLLFTYPIRIDLHVVSVAEVEAESARPHGFLSSVVSSGLALYVREDEENIA